MRPYLAVSEYRKTNNVHPLSAAQKILEGLYAHGGLSESDETSWKNYISLLEKRDMSILRPKKIRGLFSVTVHRGPCNKDPCNKDQGGSLVYVFGEKHSKSGCRDAISPVKYIKYCLEMAPAFVDFYIEAGERTRHEKISTFFEGYDKADRDTDNLYINRLAWNVSPCFYADKNTLNVSRCPPNVRVHFVDIRRDWDYGLTNICSELAYSFNDTESFNYYMKKYKTLIYSEYLGLAPELYIQNELVTKLFQLYNVYTDSQILSDDPIVVNTDKFVKFLNSLLVLERMTQIKNVSDANTLIAVLAKVVTENPVIKQSLESVRSHFKTFYRRTSTDAMSYAQSLLDNIGVFSDTPDVETIKNNINIHIDQLLKGPEWVGGKFPLFPNQHSNNLCDSIHALDAVTMDLYTLVRFLRGYSTKPYRPHNCIFYVGEYHATVYRNVLDELGYKQIQYIFEREANCLKTSDLKFPFLFE